MDDTFVERRPNRFESANGYVVEISGRYSITYIEGDRSTLIEAGALAPIGSMALYRSSIKQWSPPNEAEDLTESDRERIVSRVNAAFTWRNYQLEIM
jgi:hypothetical protein